MDIQLSIICTNMVKSPRGAHIYNNKPRDDYKLAAMIRQKLSTAILLSFNLIGHPIHSIREIMIRKMPDVSQTVIIISEKGWQRTSTNCIGMNPV